MTPIDQFVNALLSGDDERAEQTIPAMALADGAEMVSALERRLAHANADERWWVARALAALPLPHSTTILTRLMNDPDSSVRACAAMALGELHAIVGTDSVEALAAHLDDGNAHVAEICTVSLGRMGVLAVPALLDKLQVGNTLQRIRAAKALVMIESHDSIPALVAALDDENAVVTHYAEEALERMGVGMVLVKP
jgi:HEAT repeat protein